MDDMTEIINTPLEVQGPGRPWQATVGRLWTIGRANEADVHLENPRVSRDHAVLEATPEGWLLVNHSNNGMFVDGRRVERLTVTEPVTVVLGSISSGETLRFVPVGKQAVQETMAGTDDRRLLEGTTIARPPTAVHTIEQHAVTI